jgi:predicted Zn finger-like uncharacterized protein
MPKRIRCPSCNAALRVPNKLLGKNVKCPKCQKTFLAEMEEWEQSERVVREPAPARPSRAPEEYEEDEFLEEEERPHRPQRRSAEAKSLVFGPAIALLVVGIIDIVLAVLNLLLHLLGISLLAMDALRGRGGEDQDAIVVGVYVIQDIADIIMGLLITIGATKMKNLSSYGFAMTACILAMIPNVNCCILGGLPFGIWGLVVLNKPEVKDAFR